MEINRNHEDMEVYGGNMMYEYEYELRGHELR